MQDKNKLALRFCESQAFFFLRGFLVAVTFFFGLDDFGFGSGVIMGEVSIQSSGRRRMTRFFLFSLYRSRCLVRCSSQEKNATIFPDLSSYSKRIGNLEYGNTEVSIIYRVIITLLSRLRKRDCAGSGIVTKMFKFV